MNRAAARVVMVTAVLSGLVPGARADSASDVFRHANEALMRGDAARAASLYQSLVDAGVDDAALLTNLGLAHLRAGSPGRAILAFERSLDREPYGERAIRGLELARRRSLAQASKAGTAAWVESRSAALRALLRPLGERVLAWTTLVLTILFFVGLAARELGLGQGAHAPLLYAIPALGLALLAAATLLVLRRGVLREGPAAIVVEGNVTLQRSPGETGSETLLEGEETEILSVDGTFARIRSASGAEGWVPSKSVEPI